MAVSCYSPRKLIFILYNCSFHRSELPWQVILFIGPFRWPQRMSWGNHPCSLQCRCEESVVQRCVRWGSQEGALHHANSLIGVVGSGLKPDLALQASCSLQVFSVAMYVFQTCVIVCVSPRKQPACTCECRWSDSKFDQNGHCSIWQHFCLMLSIFCMFLLKDMWYVGWS